jgi:hypothetical protein
MQPLGSAEVKSSSPRWRRWHHQRARQNGRAYRHGKNVFVHGSIKMVSPPNVLETERPRKEFSDLKIYLPSSVWRSRTRAAA